MEIGNAGMTETQEELLWNEGWIKVMSSSTKDSNFTLELNKNGTRGKFDYQLAGDHSRQEINSINFWISSRVINIDSQGCIRKIFKI